MTQAAILIQSKFRSYYEQKKFQQSRRAAVLIQKYYRSYKKCGKRRQARRTAVIVQQRLRWARRSRRESARAHAGACAGTKAFCSDFSQTTLGAETLCAHAGVVHPVLSSQLILSSPPTQLSCGLCPVSPCIRIWQGPSFSCEGGTQFP